MQNIADALKERASAPQTPSDNRVTQKFQDEALRIIEKLGIKKDDPKRNSIFKCFSQHPGIAMAAYQFVADANNVKSISGMFLWKYNALLKDMKRSKEQIDPEEDAPQPVPAKANVYVQSDAICEACE